MTAVPRRILLFAIQFLLLLAVCVWLYPHILPHYERMVIAVTNPFLRHASPSLEAETNSAGELNMYVLDPGRPPQLLYARRYRPDGIFLNLVLLPALLLSTPLPMRRRTLVFLLGVVILFVVNVASLTALMRVYFCLKSNPQSSLCSWIKVFVLTSGQIGPVAVWFLLTWSYWLPAVEDRHLMKPAEIGRNSPCSCGSGRKFKHCCAR